MDLKTWRTQHSVGPDGQRLSQQQLADRLGVSRNVIFYWEAARRRPNDGHRQEIETFSNGMVDSERDWLTVDQVRQQRDGAPAE